MINYDLYDYLNTNEAFPKKYTWLNVLKHWGSKLENEVIDDLGYRNVKRGKVIFGDFGGSSPAYAKEGVMYKFFFLFQLVLKESGF